MKKTIYKILLKILRFFTKIYLWRTDPYVIGITGSVGKTSCRTLIHDVLNQIQDTGDTSSQKLRIYTSPKNYNSELGLIFSIFQIEDYIPSIKNLLTILFQIMRKSIFSAKKYDILLAEYGIDQPGDMDFLLSVMKPDIWIITKLDSVHSDNFPGWVEELWKDKCKLLLASQDQTFFNAWDDFVEIYEKMFRNPQRFFSWKIQSELGYSAYELLQYFSYAKKKISINLPGEENIEYTILALNIAQYLASKSYKKSFSFQKISPFMSLKLKEEQYNFRFELQAGRFTLFHKGENILIDSTYNGGPQSMKQCIETTQKIQNSIDPKAKIIYVLGDMREIGDEQIMEHKKLAKLLSQSEAVFTVWPVMFQYMIPELKTTWYSGEIVSSLSSREIGKKLKKYLKENEKNSYMLLFKGSQNTIFMEEALAELLTPTQQKNLPRQSEDWKKKKDSFFKSL